MIQRRYASRDHFENRESAAQRATYVVLFTYIEKKSNKNLKNYRDLTRLKHTFSPQLVLVTFLEEAFRMPYPQENG